jgi:hypothetical protein
VSYTGTSSTTGDIIVTASTDTGLGTATSTQVILRGTGQGKWASVVDLRWRHNTDTRQIPSFFLQRFLICHQSVLKAPWFATGLFYL